MGIFKRLKSLSPLTLGVALLGLIALTVITQQPQSYRSFAKRPPKPTPTPIVGLPTPTPAPSQDCACVGKGRCVKFTSENECNAANNCSWSCPVLSAPILVTPNGGEIWERGGTYNIVWQQRELSEGSVALHLYTRDTGGNDNYIGAIAYNVSNQIGTNTYSWTIPQKGSPQTNPPEDGNNIIVQVTYYDINNQLSSYDRSDSPFTITSPKPTLTTPNGGEVWERGNAYDIVWEQTQVAEGGVGLFLYTRDNSGDNYIGAIAYNVSNQIGTNTYSWTIPQKGSPETNPPNDGDNMIVEVGYYDSNGQRVSSDKSDSTFTITSPKPTLTTPNGGEVWVRGNTYDIVWYQSQVSDGSVALHLYTRDAGGDTYIGAIDYYVSNQVGTNTYSWTVPQKGSPLTNPPQDGNNVIVQVTYYDSNGQMSAYDRSDSPFTVTSSNTN